MTTTIRRLAASFLTASAVLTFSGPAAHASPPPPASNPCVAAIRAVWPDHLEGRAIAISWRESRWTPGAVNRRAVGKFGRATGCMQILPGVARRIGSTCDLRNASCNAATAWALYNYRRSGWRPWSVR
jgi:soluble lytic murein transglycosylase-like protein